MNPSPGDAGPSQTPNYTSLLLSPAELHPHMRSPNTPLDPSRAFFATGSTPGAGPSFFNHGSQYTSPFTNNANYHAQILGHASHDQLLAASSLYRMSVENTVALRAQLDALTGAYTLLAQAVPQVFTFIENPFNIAPTTNSSHNLGSIPPAPPTHSRDNNPDVRWWTRKAWADQAGSSGDKLSLSLKRKKKDSKAGSDEEGLEEEEEEEERHEPDDADAGLEEDEDDGKKQPEEDSDDGKKHILGFLEHQDGTPFTRTEREQTRKYAHEIFRTLQTAGKAPYSWSLASMEAVTFLRNHMVAKVPELALCEFQWKVDHLATSVYAQWVRWRKDTVLPHPRDTKAKRLDAGKKSVKKGGKRRKTDESPTIPELDCSGLISMTPEDETSLSSPSAPAAVPSRPPSPAIDPPVETETPIPPQQPENSPERPTAASTPELQAAPTPLTPMASSVPQEPSSPATSSAVPAISVSNPLDGLFGEAIQPSVSSRVQDTNTTMKGEPQTAPQKTKIIRHIPGSADTAYNLFGRDFIKQWPVGKKGPTTQEVRAAFTEDQKLIYKKRADDLKKIKLAAEKEANASGATTSSVSASSDAQT
ncbi:hypothetical protein FB45DRAFT_1065436 [Roridomyces roridus]|uniref:Uncharacterized protein n=1 Tax=Roridomyces roridus TaxID=1738132 RepID=A0AAD7B7T9_9AGAR|nr:hypothetical protein FB45DRAFT_1123090 [Roridomyces roridus]KAJ7612740.1 hypothetical protein FB45DRAFT_1065436 [Roridomyces roridus]